MPAPLEKLTEEFGIAVRVLDTAASTNDIAADPCFREGDAVIALEQTRGRGQAGNSWSSERGRNLTFSVVLEPDFLPAGRQFLISQAVSLAILDCLYRRGIDTRIKWPNDIYAADRKIAGILIENTVSGNELQRSVVGIGLNVNQTAFDPSLPNPTSFALETGVQADIYELFGEFYRCLMTRYALLLEQDRERIGGDYRNSLYLRDTPHTFTVDGRAVEGTIRGVDDYGQLIVEHPDGLRTYLLKQIAF